MEKDRELFLSTLKKAYELNKETKRCVENIHEIVKEFIYSSNRNMGMK